MRLMLAQPIASQVLSVSLREIGAQGTSVRFSCRMPQRHETLMTHVHRKSLPSCNVQSVCGRLRPHERQAEPNRSETQVQAGAHHFMESSLVILCCLPTLVFDFL